MDNVVVIYTSEDDLWIREYAMKEFIEELNDPNSTWSRIDWKSSVIEFDKDRANNGLIVMNGKIVRPSPVKTVTQYTLDG